MALVFSNWNFFINKNAFLKKKVCPIIDFWFLLDVYGIYKISIFQGKVLLVKKLELSSVYYQLPNMAGSTFLGYFLYCFQIGWNSLPRFVFN